MTSDTSCRLPGCCVARCRKKRNRGSKHVEKTLPQTFQNEAPGGPKWKPKWFKKWLQNGSKMAPWRPLGGPWARPCCQTLPGAVPERLWHGPGRPQAPQGRQRPPRSLQGAILRPPGSHFGAILETIFGPFLAGWDHFRPNFGTISDPPTLTLSWFWSPACCLPLRPLSRSVLCVPGFLGRRVPALALTI